MIRYKINIIILKLKMKLLNKNCYNNLLIIDGKNICYLKK